jgi:hypothetical protein
MKWVRNPATSIEDSDAPQLRLLVWSVLGWWDTYEPTERGTERGDVGVSDGPCGLADRGSGFGELLFGVFNAETLQVS